MYWLRTLALRVTDCSPMISALSRSFWALRTSRARGAVLLQPLDLGVGDLDQLVELLAGPGIQLDLERARQQLGGMRRIDLGRELPVVHERAEQPVFLGQPPQDGRQHVEGRLVGMVGRHGRPDQLGAGQAHRVGQSDVLRRRQARHARLRAA